MSRSLTRRPMRPSQSHVARAIGITDRVRANSGFPIFPSRIVLLNAAPFHGERPVIWEAMMTVHKAIQQGTCRALAAIVGLSIVLAVSDVAPAAQPWPNRPITVIVPFGAGSASDVIARVALHQVSEQVGQPIIIVNRGGAGGTLGSNLVAKAASDGYTVLATGALAAAQGLYRTLPYETLQDFVPVIPLG